MIRHKHKKGDWLVECDVCGFTIYASQSYHGTDKQTGLVVCKADYDAVNQQDHPRPAKDNQNVPFSRPQHLATSNEDDPYDPDTALPTSDTHTTHDNSNP